MSEKPDRGPLDIMFPEIEVVVGDGLKIKVHPLRMSDLPKALDVLERLLLKFEDMQETRSEFKSNFEFGAHMAVEGTREILDLLPFCIDMPLENIPAIPALPELAEAVIELNMNDLVRAKWKALIGQIMNAVGPLNQGEKKKGVLKESKEV